jgi:hypothetical protein
MLYNGQNTLLLPTASPRISYIICDECAGVGEVYPVCDECAQTQEQCERHPGCPVVTCGTCRGTGKLEIEE